ncbi:MAG: ABC transporter permease, partial [Methanomicrobiales archaeon]|nr:ABC transporter permease [Methanomicrobiales archaeon]
MKPSKILTIAWDNMKQRRFRTALTTLSVVIGITAIIGIAALGEGFRVGIKDRMQQGFELDVLVILPIGTAGFRSTFTSAEIINITNIPGVKLVTGMTTFTSGQLLNQNDTKLNAFTVSTVNFSEMIQALPKRLTPMDGEIPAQGDNDTIVLGYKTCFVNETSEPLAHVGENVTLQTYDMTINKTYRVAAILQQSGSSALTNFDYWAFTPTNPVANSSGY